MNSSPKQTVAGGCFPLYSFYFGPTFPVKHPLSPCNQVIIKLPKLMFAKTLKVYSESCKAAGLPYQGLVWCQYSSSAALDNSVWLHTISIVYALVWIQRSGLTSLLSNLRPSIETNLGEWITGKWNLHRPRAHVAGS